jgi:putative aldouronate transport system substrate-binding protein
MRRTLFILGIVMLTLAMFMAGCGQPAVSPTKGVEPTAVPTGADGPLTKYDPPIKIKTALNTLDVNVVYEGDDTPENNQWTRAYKDELGIELEFLWIAGGDEGITKMNLAIASDRLPDVFMVNQNQFESLAKAGKLADITEAYDTYAGAFMKQVMARPGSDAAFKISSYYDKLYGVPYFLNGTDDTKNIWIRYDWMQKLKLPEPKTMQDFLAIAEAFVTQDPDGNSQADTLGFAMHSGSFNQSGAGLAGFFNAYHAYPNIWVKDADGKLVAGQAQAAPMKAALTELRSLYERKMIDQNYASLNFGESVRPKMLSNKIGMMFAGLWFGWGPIGDMKIADPTVEWRSYPVLSADGKPAKAATSTLMMQQLNVVRAGFDHPEALIKMLNLVNEKLWNSTPEVFSKFGYDASWNNAFTMSPLYFEGPGKNLTLYQNTVKALESGDASKLNGEETLIYNWMVDYRDKNDVSRIGVWLSYGPGSSCSKMEYYQNNDLYQFNEFYGSSPQSMLDNTAILEKLFLDYALKIVSGEIPVEKYDEFVTEWYAQGGKQITDDVNAWYASFK